MAVALAAFLECIEVRRIGVLSIGLALLPITCDAVALDVAQVDRDGVRASAAQHHEAALDDDAPGIRTQTPAGHGGRDTASAEGVGRPPGVLA
ncbi:hypothetical protein D3C71_744240 [compost metagenome]